MIPFSCLSPVADVRAAVSLKSHCKDLTAFYLPKVDGKIACVLRKAAFSGVHVPVTRCFYSPNQDGSMCVSMPVILVKSLVHKVDYVYLPDGEVEQLKHTWPHCCMQFYSVFCFIQKLKAKRKPWMLSFSI